MNAEYTLHYAPLIILGSMFNTSEAQLVMWGYGKVVGKNIKTKNNVRLSLA